MTRDHEIDDRPLPVVLRPISDELLSSWLARHAAYYCVTAPFFARWLALGTDNPSITRRTMRSLISVERDFMGEAPVASERPTKKRSGGGHIPLGAQ